MAVDNRGAGSSKSRKGVLKIDTSTPEGRMKARKPGKKKAGIGAGASSSMTQPAKPKKSGWMDRAAKRRVTVK
jgi:hypothetical protein